MNRRDFLLFRVRDTRRVMELSCERLYMRYLSVRAGAALATQDGGPGSEDSSWSGEPPTIISQPGWPELVTELEREVDAVDIVRVRDTEWMIDGSFRSDIDRILSGFAAKGGTVEFERAGPPPDRERSES